MSRLEYTGRYEAKKNKYAYAATLLIMGEDEETVREEFGFDTHTMKQVIKAGDALEDGNHELFYEIIQKLST